MKRLIAAFILIAGCSSPTPPPQRTAPTLHEGQYLVEKDDMLSSVAFKKYGDGELWHALLNANPDLKVRPGFAIYAGEVINTPGINELDRSVPKSVFPETLPAKYVILPGDSLRFIAGRVYGDKEKWRMLYEANKERLPPEAAENPSKLTAGTQIILPKK